MSFKQRRKAAVVLLVSGFSVILAALGAPQASNAEEASFGLSAVSAQAHARFLVTAFQAAGAYIQSGNPVPITDVESLNTATGLTTDSQGVFTDFTQGAQVAQVCMKFTDGVFIAMQTAVTGETSVRYSVTGCDYENTSGVVVEGFLPNGVNGTSTEPGEWSLGGSLMGDWLPGNLAGGTLPQ